MNTWLILVEVDCTDPERVDELDAWYAQTHIPELLQVPGIVRVTRYENVTPGGDRSRFATLLEVETDDVWQVTALLQENAAREEREGRRPDLLRIVGGTVYRRISENSR